MRIAVIDINVQVVVCHQEHQRLAYMSGEFLV
jgi:hypothetical protein